MPLRTKILLINFAIVCGLALEYYRGAPIFAIVITGVALLLVANTILFLKAKSARQGK
jgi:hypothetical protein